MRVLCWVPVVVLVGCLSPVDETPLGAHDAGAGGMGGGVAGGSTAGGGTAGGTTAVGGGAASSITCSRDGFCWHGQAYGGAFHAVAGTSSSFVMAVGEGGVFATWNGSAWALAQSPTRNTLRGVWFASPTEGWAVGDGGVLLQWNGSTFTPLASGTTRDLHAIHGQGAVVYVGGNEVLLTRQNGAWSSLSGVLPVTDSSSVVRSIAVVSSSEVYVAGVSGGGFFKRFDGTTWSDVSASRTEGPTDSDTLYSVAACGSTLFASGVFSGETHGSWTRRAGVWASHFPPGGRLTCLTDAEFLSFGGAPASHEAVALVSLSGQPEQQVALGLNVLAGWAAGPREAFLVGGRGLLLRWTGPMLRDPSTSRTSRIFAFSATNVWRLSGPSSLERLDGATWTPVTMPAGTGYLDLYSPGAGELWLVRSSGVHHLVNGAWTQLRDVPPGTTFVRGASASDVWFSGSAGAVSKWTGSELLTYLLPTQATTGPMHVTRTQVWVPTSTSNGLGATYQRVNGSWQRVVGVDAWRVSGSGDEVYFTGVGTLSRWRDGRVTELGRDFGTRELAATATHLYLANSAWVGDGTRTTLKRVTLSDGVMTDLEIGTSADVNSIAATPDGHVWLSTQSGGLLHLAP